MCIRIFVVLCLMLIFTIATTSLGSLSFVPSIVPPHHAGFFVEFTALGYSSGFFEVSTQPILDLLGAFNLRFRMFLTTLLVFNIEGYVYDPLFVPKVYGGLPNEEQILVLLGRGYWHTNVPFGWMVLRTHLELFSLGAYISVQNDSGYAIPFFTRGFVSFGIPLSGNFELFGNIEGGVLVDVLTSNVRDEEWNEMIQEAREKSTYVALRGGLTSYFPPSSES